MMMMMMTGLQTNKYRSGTVAHAACQWRHTRSLD